MPYSVPTLRQLIASGALDLEASLGTVLPKFGIELALNTSVSAAIRDLYDHQAWIVRQIIPTTESDDQTIIETAQFEGVIRKQATYAAGPATLNGTVPAPVGTLLQHKDGRQYAVTTSASPSSGTVAVEVQAVEVGAGGNLAAGEVLTLVTPVPGLQSNGVSGDISGGADIEPIAELLERLLFRKRNPPMGGAVADYLAWMREVPGVTRAWAYDAWQGGGTLPQHVLDGNQPLRHDRRCNQGVGVVEGKVHTPDKRRSSMTPSPAARAEALEPCNPTARNNHD